MRVAFVTNLCPHYRRPLFEQLAAAHDVDYYLFAESGERYWNPQLRSQRGNFRVRELPSVEWMGQRLMPGLARAITGSQYDVVVKCLNGRLMVPYVFGVAKVRRVPIVLWTGMWYHPRTIFHSLSRPLTELIYHGADAVVAYGEHVKRFLAKSAGVPTRKIFVAGQAVEGRRFSSLPRTATDIPEFVYVGQFEERKGVGDLLRSMDLLRGARLRLRVIGNGPMETVIRERANRPDSVEIELVGHVAQNDLPGELARSRALILPSVTTRRDREPWGLVVNEAMHAGVPVIATDAVGAAAGGLVQNNRNGVIVPEGRPDRLAAAIRRFVDDHEWAAALGGAASHDVEVFSYSRMVQVFTAAMEYATRVR